MGEQPITLYPEALEILRAKAMASALHEKEEIDLAHALGRVLAADLVSPEVLPNFDNSAMDGYAVISKQTECASPQDPLRLRILGQLAAGDSPLIPHEQKNQKPGAWEIMTGAPFPEDFDACVRLEDVKIFAETREIEITHPVRAAQNRRQRGEDFREGAPLLLQGRRLRAEDILCLASLGLTTIPVLRKLRVGLISTGKELIPLQKTPAPGQVRNSSAPYVCAYLKNFGIDVVHLGTIPDQPEIFQNLLQNLPEEFDLILTTGAISMGKYDFVGPILEKLDTTFYFRKVAMRPGKPILFGKLRKGSFFIGLPGNPISGAVGLRFFVIPFLQALQSQAQEQPLRLRLDQDLWKPPGTTCFFKGHLRWTEEGSYIQLSLEQRPSMMHPLLESSYWVSIPASAEEVVPARSWVDAFPFLSF